jgi:hypothetical protein
MTLALAGAATLGPGEHRAAITMLRRVRLHRPARYTVIADAWVAHIGAKTNVALRPVHLEPIALGWHVVFRRRTVVAREAMKLGRMAIASFFSVWMCHGSLPLIFVRVALNFLITMMKPDQ